MSSGSIYTNVTMNYFVNKLHTHLVGRVFVNGPGDMGSMPGHVIPKTLKVELDNSLLNTQQ